jgi:hypothetical protein
LAHGVGSRADLPIPLWLAVCAAALAVIASFAALGVLWKKSRLRGSAAGRPLPAWLQRFLDSRLLRRTLQMAVFAAAVLVLVVALFGPPDIADNLAPWALYVTFWVGLVPASLLLGPVWRVVNPLRTAHAMLAWATRVDRCRGLRELPPTVGYWPAAAALLAFTWLELAYPDRADPRVVGVFLAWYAAGQVVAAMVFGDRWFASGDGFEVYATLLGSLAPLGRRDDGRLVLRNPLHGADAVAARPGLVAVVCTLVGSTAFDGLSRSRVWQNQVHGRGVGAPTVGLVACVAAVAVLYIAATRLAALISGQDAATLPARFAHSILPIAAGYAIAHYFTLFLFDGQQTFTLLSDPFAKGWDLFGTAGHRIDYTLVGTRTIALVQVAAIVIGHMVGVVLAHDRAIRLTPDAAIRAQYPLLGVMVFFTVAAVALLLGP